MLESLRRQLREKFPQAHGLRAAEAVEAMPAGGAGFAVVDAFPAGCLSEVVAGGPVSGLGLWVAEVLEETGDPGEADGGDGPPVVVLIDGRDAFDPASFGVAACSRVLWVRCRAVGEMLRAADMLVRDGNVPLVLLDATGLERGDLAACPATVWWRLQRAAAGGGLRVVVMVREPLIPCAARRWRLSAEVSLADFDRRRGELRRVLRRVEERRQRVH